MRILLDVCIILDLLLSGRGYQETASKALIRLTQNNYQLLFPASSIDTVIFILGRIFKSEKESISKLKVILKEYEIHVLSSTGNEFLNIDGTQNSLICNSAKRFGPDTRILTRDLTFDGQGVKIMNYQDVPQLTAETQSIPILDLSREYHLMMEEVDEALLSVAASSQFIMGAQVSEFEDQCAEYIASSHAIGTSSGTDALVLALRALAIQKKEAEFFASTDLVITTPFTFAATGDSILRAGATPIFVDIEPDGFNIDTINLQRLIDKKVIDPNQVVGILPVHLFGNPCQLDNILNLANKYNWFVVEDVAQAFGATWKEQKLGSIGTIGTFSFFPTKNLGGFGDGGLVCTDDDNLAELVRMLLRHGGKDKYNVDHIGYNARLDTLQAAVLQVRLKYIDSFNHKRKQIAQAYDHSLSECPAIVTPKRQTDGYDVVHQYTIRINNSARDDLQKYLSKIGISSAVYYPMPLHKMGVFDQRSEVGGELKNAEKASGEVLSLPIEPLMTKNEIDQVTTGIKDFLT